MFLEDGSLWESDDDLGKKGSWFKWYLYLTGWWSWLSYTLTGKGLPPSDPEELSPRVFKPSRWMVSGQMCDQPIWGSGLHIQYFRKKNWTNTRDIKYTLPACKHARHKVHLTSLQKGSAGKSTCQDWGLEFNSWDPLGGRKNLTPTSCLLTWYNICAHTLNKFNKTSGAGWLTSVIPVFGWHGQADFHEFQTAWSTQLVPGQPVSNKPTKQGLGTWLSE